MIEFTEIPKNFQLLSMAVSYFYKPQLNLSRVSYFCRILPPPPPISHMLHHSNIVAKRLRKGLERIQDACGSDMLGKCAIEEQF